MASISRSPTPSSSTAPTATASRSSINSAADATPEENQRLRMYKRIAGAQTQADLDDVRAELQDRYGEPPESVLNLLAAGELRLRCEQLGIAQLDRKRTQVELPNPNGNKKQPLKTFVEMLHLKFAEGLSGSSNEASKDAKPHAIDPGVLMRLVSRNTKRGAQFTPQGILRWPIPSAKAEDVITETRALLDPLDPQRYP